ncbi:conserved hypothetical protein [Methanococcus vannielii SB]|jgi:hypothetical protein|uniref:Nucleic acid binding OB-fold tRNA/helicase-type n=1 Tax=Methanococcus vannielii (strain ATCC 35089 / DSM 1224 / JCM 13029 / OCM 148 / SB) TaxID=406327 RepID=A6URA4_METVS|nr:hypothetical protein [Methanococcus vannielii]ABR55026.1 conserved hypothetical protein [Methanococcus vannielii SB]
MYTFEKINNIGPEDIEKKVAILGIITGIKSDENRDRLEVENGSFKIEVSNDEKVHIDVLSKVIVFGTVKITPKGIMIYSDSIIQLKNSNPKLIAKFIEKIEKYN